MQVFGTIEGNSTFGTDYSETPQWFDAFRADITTNGAWDGLIVEGGLVTTCTVPSDSIRFRDYAGVTTYSFTGLNVDRLR